MKEQDFQIRVIRFLSGEMSAVESEHLLKAISESAEKQKFFEEYQEIWEKAEIQSPIPEVDLPEQWQQFENQAFVEEPAPRVIPIWSRQIFKIAAMMAIIVSTILAWSIMTKAPIDSMEMVMHETSVQVQEIALPDGSKVWLNQGSKVEYASNFQPRTIHLTGEAIFEVRHLSSDETFTVETDVTKVTVLGTVFMVNSGLESKGATVFVKEGKVAFEALDKKENVEILTAGQQAVYNVNLHSVSRIENPSSNLFNWRTGSFSFNDSPLAEILPALESYFGVKFNIANPDLLSCTYNSEFSNMNIEEMLEELSFGLNLEIHQKQPGVYVVDGIPCK
ncbi:MAG: FecR domain-containing protein [Saprospiraceae bacterium]|nr:FecR domain-containing protein [Saprospiraceae bacterium]